MNPSIQPTERGATPLDLQRARSVKIDPETASFEVEFLRQAALLRDPTDSATEDAAIDPEAERGDAEAEPGEEDLLEVADLVIAPAEPAPPEPTVDGVARADGAPAVAGTGRVAAQAPTVELPPAPATTPTEPAAPATPARGATGRAAGGEPTPQGNPETRATPATDGTSNTDSTQAAATRAAQTAAPEPPVVEPSTSRAATAEARSREVHESRAERRHGADAAEAEPTTSETRDRAVLETTRSNDRGTTTPAPIAEPKAVAAGPTATAPATPVAEPVAPPAPPLGVQDATSVANQVPPVARPSAIGNPVPVQEILAQVRMHVRHNGVRDLRMQLDPPELGRLSLRFLLDGETLRVVVRASRTEVVAALKNELSSFHNTLRDAGVDLASLDIDLDNGSQAPGSHADHGPRSESARPRDEREHRPLFHPIAEPSMPSRTLVIDGRLDVLA